MIGIFDSGIGGLTVVSAIIRELPEYDLIYFGDTARTPYGTKSPQTVVNYAIENTAFLLGKGAEIIVMACNTASSVATAQLGENYPGIPVFEVISPAVSRAVALTKTQNFGVIGTRATIKSKVYEEKIRAQLPGARIYSAACPLLVPLVEEGWLKKPETRMIVKKYLHPLKTRQVDTLILGCTHYPILKPIIRHKIGKQAHIIDSSEATAGRIAEFLKANPQLDRKLGKNRDYRFFVSDVTEQFEKTAKLILNRKIRLEKVNL